MAEEKVVNYVHYDVQMTDANGTLWPKFFKLLYQYAPPPRRVFEAGCGTGTTANRMQSLGYSVLAVDSSESGIELARGAFPGVDFQLRSIYDELPEQGTFDLVVSLEVIEHLMAPELLVKRCYESLKPGGIGVLSTPFHGYWKNLALAISGKMDRHYNALWSGGHIKFFSKKTLGLLLREAGFEVLELVTAGRIPALAKSMIVVVRKPE